MVDKNFNTPILKECRGPLPFLPLVWLLGHNLLVLRLEVPRGQLNDEKHRVYRVPYIEDIVN